MKKILIPIILIVLAIVVSFIIKKENIYESKSFNISFEKPEGLYVKENKNGIMMVEDTQENRDLLDGKSTIAREGPTAITVEVYENPEYFPNLYLANSATSTAEVNGEKGISYSWSGLYEGKTIVISREGKNYAFSVTWLTKQDRLLNDFEKVLETVDF